MTGVKLCRLERLIILGVALLIAILPERGASCVITPRGHNVGTNFVVEVSYSGKPLQGIEINLSREMNKEPYFVLVRSTFSDDEGRVSIRRLTPGHYLLVVKHAGIEGDAADLNVVSKDQANKFVEDELKLSWPSRKVFKVREIAGVLVRTPFDFTKRITEPPLAGAKLTLIDALSATRRGTFTVGIDGRFSFTNLNPGLYIVQVKQDKKINLVGYLEEEIEGDIFVEIASNSVDQEIPLLRLYMSDCGMGMRGKDGNEIF
jgi:hypothetical protein